MSQILLMLHAASTLFMVGLIWFVQVVHYPLFGSVGVEAFEAYEADHNRLTSWVVIPPMLIELSCAIALVWIRPQGVTSGQVYLGIGLLVIVWLSTFLLQVPQHTILLEGFNSEAHRKLVVSNWIRTFAWSVRGVIALWMIRS